jgi:hypothetical protein
VGGKGKDLIVNSGLQYFTHTVDGAVYGAWFRVISPDQVEVMTVGLLETGTFSFNPEIAARSILENFVRWRARAGAPIPCLDSMTASERSEATGLAAVQPEKPSTEAGKFEGNVTT